MTSTQLILLALTCINENREPSHTEQSRIYVFYKTEIDDKAISINEFILLLSNSSLYCQIEQPKRAPVIELIESYLSSSADKSHARKQNNHAQSRKSNSVSKRFPRGYEYSKEDQMLTRLQFRRSQPPPQLASLLLLLLIVLLISKHRQQHKYL